MSETDRGQALREALLVVLGVCREIAKGKGTNDAAHLVSQSVLVLADGERQDGAGNPRTLKM